MESEASVHERLREQLDQYSVGFPATESGIEIDILKRLFSEEEARMYLDLSMMLESPESVARRTGRDPGDVAGRLEEMARKGLIFRHRKADSVRYAAVPFVVGTYEFQLKNLDRELAGMLERYLQEAFLKVLGNNVVPMRTIPVHQAVDASSPVAPYQDARQIVRSQKKISVADCLCRTQKGILEEGCDKPLEVCLLFGSHADYYVENGMARFIGVDEALDILDRCEKAGLVCQPHNTVNPGGMCNCCGDCCGILRGLKHLPKPSEAVFNIYHAAVDDGSCDACETCLERCQMEAITIGPDGIAVVDLDRCIGCGLCVTACPPQALRLDRKPEEQRRMPPASGQELMTTTAEIRGTSLIPLAVLRKSTTAE